MRLFTAEEVSGLLRSQGLRVLRAGTRRDLLGILLIPYNAWMCKRVHGYAPGGVFWDLFGFADYVLAERPVPTEPSSPPTN